MVHEYYAPEFDVMIDGARVPAELRCAISSVSLTSALEGADRVEVSVANQDLRWLDEPLLELENSFRLDLGYAPDPLSLMFVGRITGVASSFPASGVPQLTVTAQDARHRMKEGRVAAWQHRPVPSYANLPRTDPEIGASVAKKYELEVKVDPVGAKLALVLAAATSVGLATDPDSAQKAVRRQINESDYDFLRRIARQNGLEMVIDHTNPAAGLKLRFFSPLDQLNADLELEYGRSLIEFTPRESNVGQVTAVTANVWVSAAKKQFGVTLEANAAQPALTLSVSPKPAPPDDPKNVVILDEPLTPATAPHRLLEELMPRLNERLTGSGSTIGDPRIRAGSVLCLSGLGARFGGLYRVTSATHTIDTSGYRTRFDVRKEIWFKGVPAEVQKAVKVRRELKIKI